ncbi:hypothetical protein BDW68DRAFT_172030 [Aspergillus falconensis]
MNLKDKSCSHAGVAYYNEEIATRSSLRVLPDAPVERIVLKKEAGGPVVATGLQLASKDGLRRTVNAATEAVLSAGAVKRPQLLELSGIDGAELLNKQGTEMLVERPNVGETGKDMDSCLLAGRRQMASNPPKPCGTQPWPRWPWRPGSSILVRVLSVSVC